MTFTKIYVIIITENKKGIDYMKKHTFSYETGKTEKSYQVKIPENVVEFKVVKKPNGIFLQYVTESDKRIEWAKDIENKYFSKIETSYCDTILGVSFVQLYGGEGGFSRCSKKDRFNPVIGKAVAICRAVGEKVPDFI